ncbi:DNA adenine methylase [Bremerella sp. JC770]|uniref:DNA adenine methylase n=1 Tax=Bremerella sp. JC770 TaxID=3232137 RepID=UPI003457D6BB
MRFISPLRYPGGKACLAGLLEDTIDLNRIRGARYFEPFAGGAGAALSLLRQEAVSELYLNDLDSRIYAFWKSCLGCTSQFIDRIMTVELSIREWQQQYTICRFPSRYKQFDVGFAAFFMNRCNRSGVLTGAGPIGGFEQQGKWKMDVRFTRDTLAERIAFLGQNRSRIHVSRLDAIAFLKQKLPRGKDRQDSFVYLDPPYVVKGTRLYLNAFEQTDHANLARYMNRQTTVPWIMSYDDDPLIRQLYSENRIATLSIEYTLQDKRSAKELIITPSYVATPSSCRISGSDRKLVRMHGSN